MAMILATVTITKVLTDDGHIAIGIEHDDGNGGGVDIAEVVGMLEMGKLDLVSRTWDSEFYDDECDSEGDG